MKSVFLRLAALTVILVFAGSLTAQTRTGSVSGTVIDPSRAPVAGATVRIINDATHETHTTTTGNAGAYLFPIVPVGQYSLEAESRREHRAEDVHSA